MGQRNYPNSEKIYNKIACIDLFAGPGRYDEGTKSTPIYVLEQAIQDENLCNMLVTLFNDLDAKKVQSLEKEIKKITGIESLKYNPIINNEEVGYEIVKEFEQMKLIPTLFFVDPWGYKGLSLRLINSVLKDWAVTVYYSSIIIELIWAFQVILLMSIWMLYLVLVEASNYV